MDIENTEFLIDVIKKTLVTLILKITLNPNFSNSCEIKAGVTKNRPIAIESEININIARLKPELSYMCNNPARF